jgi:hypothetical protein
VVLAGSEAVIEATVVRDGLVEGEGKFGRGIQVQPHPPSTTMALLTLRSSLVARNREFGVSVVNSNALVESTAIVATAANDLGLYGDGLAAIYDDPTRTPASVTSVANLVDDSARAGATCFGSSMSLANTAVLCAAFPLDGEPLAGASFAFEDAGGNVCGCPPEDGPCKMVSAGLAPPEQLPPTE